MKVRTTRWWWIGVAVLLGSCGGASMAETEHTSTEAGGQGGETYVTPELGLTPEEQRTVSDWDALVTSYDEQLSTDPTGCQSACDLAGRICELSERICTIAERHPGDGRLEDRCTDGRTRCSNANQTVARCSCLAAPDAGETE